MVIVFPCLTEQYVNSRANAFIEIQCVNRGNEYVIYVNLYQTHNNVKKCLLKYIFSDRPTVILARDEIFFVRKHETISYDIISERQHILSSAPFINKSYWIKIGSEYHRTTEFAMNLMRIITAEPQNYDNKILLKLPGTDSLLLPYDVFKKCVWTMLFNRRAHTDCTFIFSRW
jgi:hypothetical protein